MINIHSLIRTLINKYFEVDVFTKTSERNYFNLIGSIIVALWNLSYRTKVEIFFFGGLTK